MALVQEMDSPPLFSDNTPYPAGLVRRVLGRFIGGLVGRFGNTDFAVTLSGSTVTVAPGRASIPSPATEVGTYFVESTSSTILTLDPADATRDRVDRLVARVAPPLTPTGPGKWFLEIRKGEPSAAPAPPDAGGTYLIAEFLVPKASDGVLPSVVDKRLAPDQHYLSGLPLFGDTRPTAARFGQVWTSRPDRQTWVFDGVSWVRLNQGVPAYSDTASVVAPYPDQIIFHRAEGSLKRYNGTSFEELAVTTPMGKRWKTEGFQSIPDGDQGGLSGGLITVGGSRVSGGMTTAPNGLVVPRDGLYRVRLNGYASAGSNYRASFSVRRDRTSATQEILLYISFDKPDGFDYTGATDDILPLKAGDVLTMWGASTGGAGNAWGVKENAGAGFSAEYVRSLPPGTTPV